MALHSRFGAWAPGGGAGVRVDVGTFEYNSGVNSDSHTFSAHSPGFTAASGDYLVVLITAFDAGGSDGSATLGTVTVGGQSAVNAVQSNDRSTGFRLVAIAAVTGVTGASFDISVSVSGYSDTIDDWGVQVLRIARMTSTTALDTGTEPFVNVDETISGTRVVVAIAGAPDSSDTGTSVTIGGDPAQIAYNANGVMTAYKTMGFDSASASPSWSGFSVESDVIATFG